MKNIINRYNEIVANNEKINHGLIYGALAVQAVCTIVIISVSYFGGMRKGVDITDNWYDERKKETDTNE